MGKEQGGGVKGDNNRKMESHYVNNYNYVYMCNNNRFQVSNNSKGMKNWIKRKSKVLG